MVFWLSFTVYVVADEKEGKGGGGGLRGACRCRKEV